MSKSLSKILPILAVVIVIAGVVVATMVNRKNNDEQGDNKPVAELTGNQDPANPATGAQTAQPTRPQVKLGNDDEAIIYDGPGTERGDGMDTGQGLGYNLGNPDAGIGLSPIAEYDDIDSYVSVIYGEADPESMEVYVSGQSNGKAVQGFIELSGNDSHIRRGDRDVYIIAGKGYVKDGTDYNETEGLKPVTANDFIKMFKDAFSNGNVKDFKHRIESDEKSDAPVNGETVLNFTIDAEKTRPLTDVLNGALYGTAAEDGLTGNIEVEMRLDRWGCVTEITLKDKDLSLGSEKIELGGYKITFSSFDAIPAIYLPGTEPVKPDEGTENNKGKNTGGGGGVPDSEDISLSKGSEVPIIPSEGVPATANPVNVGMLPEAHKDGNIIYHMPAAIFVGEGVRTKTDDMAMINLPYSSFEVIPGVSVLYTGLSWTLAEKSQGAALCFKIENATDTDATITIPYITVNSNVSGRKEKFLTNQIPGMYAEAGKTVYCTVNTGELGSYADLPDFKPDSIGLEFHSGEGSVTHISEIVYVYNKDASLEEYISEHWMAEHNGQTPAYDKRTYHRHVFFDSALSMAAGIINVDPSAGGSGTEGVTLRITSEHLYKPIVIEIDRITIEGDGASVQSDFNKTYYDQIPYEDMLLYPFTGTTMSFTYGTKNSKCTLAGGKASIKIKLRVKEYYTGDYIDFNDPMHKAKPASKLKNNGYIEITM